MTYLTVKQISSRLAVSVPTVWRWSRDAESNFPRPIKLGKNCTRWRLDDIEAWEASRQGVA